MIRVNEWLLPLSWLYGLGVKVRNLMFEWGILKSKSYRVPVISIGNLTVGGTGKTPHTEYLINLLQKKYKVAVLSRGYKRRSKGFLLAGKDTPMSQIGDEPCQMKHKFPDVYVAVDKNRCRGIERLCAPDIQPQVDVVLLDDAYQHRYVKPGINILLVDYHRMICDDKLLPAGRLREPWTQKNRANIVIVTKCPKDLKPMEFRVVNRALKLYPYQKLFFSTFVYGKLMPLFGGTSRKLSDLRNNEHVLLLTGIASPEQMKLDLEKYTGNIRSLSFGDHHYYTDKDVAHINSAFEEMPANSLIVTTEKDGSRLTEATGFSEAVRNNLYVLPIEVAFMQNRQDMFNENILDYVLKNSRNSILAKD